MYKLLDNDKDDLDMAYAVRLDWTLSVEPLTPLCVY